MSWKYKVQCPETNFEVSYPFQFCQNSSDFQVMEKKRRKIFWFVSLGCWSMLVIQNSWPLNLNAHRRYIFTIRHRSMLENLSVYTLHSLKVAFEMLLSSFRVSKYAVAAAVVTTSHLTCPSSLSCKISSLWFLLWAPCSCLHSDPPAPTLWWMKVGLFLVFWPLLSLLEKAFSILCSMQLVVSIHGFCSCRFNHPQVRSALGRMFRVWAHRYRIQ